MNERGRVAQRHREVFELSSPDLHADRFDVASIDGKKTRTTPFDLASSTTTKIWTLGRQNYAVAHDHVDPSGFGVGAHGGEEL
ncbi:hypothetical protein PUN28_007045 [Cardiocondyla obscurior]|uniref:Uncharacterized protein n=1 Tax=Cardiocondyla obscurior TaxID=286306 RepID=A0AAW2G1P6_9HYME